MIKIQKKAPPGTDQKPPFWNKLQLAEGGISATLTCPRGHLGTLEDHEIASDGTVTPSVVCDQICDWHVHVQLEGWEG